MTLTQGLDIVQYAWVVDSLDEAMAGWLTMGVGPFHTMDLHWDDTQYRGSTIPVGIRVGLAQAGAVQIELIEQTTPGDSFYRDVVPAGRSGFHHVCIFRDDVEQYAQAMRDNGTTLAGVIPRGQGNNTYYIDTRAQLGCMLEVLSGNDKIRAIYALVAASAKDWDGMDPVRALTAEALAPYSAG